MAKPTEQQLLLARLLKDDPAENAHYEAFGRFIAAYSYAEASVHRLVRHYSGTDDQKARILIGGLRLGEIIDRLRSLLIINQLRDNRSILSFMMPDKDAIAIDESLTQLAIISDKRHKLVHRSLSYGEEGFKVTDIFTAKRLANFENHLITLADLKAMRMDCTVISIALSEYLGDLEPAWDAAHPRPAWRYRPPPPAPQKEPRMKARKSRKLQQRASGAKLKGE
jgi:hypothetical protein